MSIDRDAVRAWVEATCAAQGVPVLVTDAGAVSRLRVLLSVRGSAGGAPAGVRRGPRRSEGPAGHDSVRVQSAGSGGAGEDGRVVQDGSDDRGLPGEVEAAPGIA